MATSIKKQPMWGIEKLNDFLLITLHSRINDIMTNHMALFRIYVLTCVFHQIKTKHPVLKKLVKNIILFIILSKKVMKSCQSKRFLIDPNRCFIVQLETLVDFLISDFCHTPHRLHVASTLILTSGISS